MRVIKPVERIFHFQDPTLFLAGSIEMGKAKDWQTKVQDALKDYKVTIFNPRRDDWDSSWEQSIMNAQFRDQVEWELEHLNKARYKIFYFEPNTKSPITLLELGLMAERQGVMVCCPPGFWRKGNVDIVCKQYRLPTYTDLDQMIKILKTRFTKKPKTK